MPLGYERVSFRNRKWGINYLREFLLIENTYCFSTVFNKNENEAQATLGDSGSGVFQKNNNKNELVGIVLSVSQLQNYTPFGSRTYIADLSKYKDQIEKFLDK